MYNKEGVSAIIVNTEKGKAVFDLIREKLHIKECQIIEIIDGINSLKESCNRPDKRDSFFEDIDKHNIIELTNKYVPKKSFFNRCLSKAKRILIKMISKIIN